jgi:hypothetical protein
MLNAGMILGGSGLLNVVLGYFSSSNADTLILEDSIQFYNFPSDWNSYPIAWQLAGGI